jgi:hypothetical protein
MNKNVFVFGAGASLCAGYPDSKKLLIEILKNVNQEKFKNELKIVKDRIGSFFPNPESSNFEEYLSLCVLTQNFSLLATKLELEHSLDYDLLQMLRSYFIDVYNDREKYNWKPYLDFVGKFYKPSDTLITFNYDWILEKILQEKGHRVNLQPWQFVDGTILRPHGSCAWIQGISGDKLIGIKTQRGTEFIKFKEYEGGQLLDAEGLIWYLPAEADLADENGIRFSAGIVPPTWYKGIETKELKAEKFFRDCWHRIINELEAASAVYIIGCSFNEADLLSRIYFRWGLANKNENQVFFINPNEADFSKFKEKIFPSTVHLNEKFEAFVERPQLP